MRSHRTVPLRARPDKNTLGGAREPAGARPVLADRAQPYGLSATAGFPSFQEGGGSQISCTSRLPCVAGRAEDQRPMEPRIVEVVRRAGVRYREPPGVGGARCGSRVAVPSPGSRVRRTRSRGSRDPPGGRDPARDAAGTAALRTQRGRDRSTDRGLGPAHQPRKLMRRRISRRYSGCCGVRSRGLGRSAARPADCVRVGGARSRRSAPARPRPRRRRRRPTPPR